MELIYPLTGIVLLLIKTGSAFVCYSCSYQLSADPTVNYDCVNEPWNVTQGSPTVPCTAPYQCITKATFESDMKQIRSVTRSCLPQQELCSGERCCNKDGVYPTCEHKCRDNLCNNRNAEEWKATSDGNMGVSSHSASYLNFLLASLVLASVTWLHNVL